MFGSCVVALAACSGAGAPLTPQGINARPVRVHASPHGGIRVAFTMHWPARKTRVAGRQGAAWISPSTASVIVVVNEDPRYTTVANAPQKSRVSTIEIAAPAGQDSFDVTLYDAPQKPHEKIAQGNDVGEAIVAKKVVANARNVLEATIAGIPSIVTAAPAPNQTMVRTNPKGGYSIVGNAPQRFIVTAQDADGNTIVPQPAVGMRAGGASAGYYAVAPVKGKSQTFDVSVIAPNPGAQPTQLTLSAHDDTGDSVTGLLPVSELSALYVSYAKSSSGGPAIAVYDDTGAPVPMPSGAFADLQDPRQLAYDPVHSRLYVADRARNGGAIVAFDGYGKPVAGLGPFLLPGAVGVVYDPDNGVLYAGALDTQHGQSTNAVAAYNADGSAAALLGATANSYTSALAYLPDSDYQFPYIAIANSQKSKPSDPILWLYREDFSSDLPVTPPSLTGIADATGIVTLDLPQFVACGTPRVAGANDVVMQDRFGAYQSSVDVPDCQGVAYDPNAQLVYVTSSSSSSIMAVGLDAGDVELTSTLPARSIATPPSSGLSDPLRIAIVY